MSHHSHRLLRKIPGNVPRAQRDDLSEIWGEEILSLGDENTSEFERQNAIGKPMSSVAALEENDMTHEKMMELEPLLETSGEQNLHSIEISHGECPCHCLAQTVWYPEHSNLCLVWDVEEIRSIGLPEHQQKVTILVVSTMLALRWIEENVTKYRESKTPTAESIYAIDYSRRLELFETVCKIFAIPMKVRHVWSRIRFFPWFRATLQPWLYIATKDHQKEYRQFLAEIGPEAFKRPLLTYGNAITTGWKRVGSCLEIKPKQDTGGGLGEERELEPAQFLLLGQGIENERFTELGNEVAEAEGVDAILRTIESMGRNCDQL